MTPMEPNVTAERWKIFRGALRPGIIDRQIMEIQTKSGVTVIPWGAFDDCLRPMHKHLAVARNIVRTHNEDLRRAQGES